MEQTFEVNKIVIKDNDGAPIVYAGSGDNVIYAFDLNENKKLTHYAGHTDYIHDLKLYSDGNMMASASEDGSVRLWDLRTRHAHHIIEPSKKSNIARSDAYISCLDVSRNSEWLVCGGGPKLTMWNMRSFANTSVMDTPKNVQQNVVKFIGTEVISGGSSYNINRYTINGILKSSSTTTIKNVMSLIYRKGLLTVCGFSNGVDIFSKANYRDLTFLLRKI